MNYGKYATCIIAIGQSCTCSEGDCYKMRYLCIYNLSTYTCTLYAFFLQGVGTVVSGTCMQGVIHLNDTLLLGPTGLGEFLPIVIRGIQRKRLPVSEVRGGQTASFALKKVKSIIIPM